jgi:hypothetical protein
MALLTVLKVVAGVIALALVLLPLLAAVAAVGDAIRRLIRCRRQGEVPRVGTSRGHPGSD